MKHATWPWRLLLYRLALLMRRRAPPCLFCGSRCQVYDGLVEWVWEVRRFICIDCGETNYCEWGSAGPRRTEA